MPPITRRTLLAGLGAVALAGCSAGRAEPPADTVGGTASGTGSLSGAASGTASGSAAATASGAATELPSPPPVPDVTVNTAVGPVTVPGAPMRVVALDTAELDSSLTLGITPVGAALAPLDTGFPDYWPASRLSGITRVGAIGDPDLSTLRALRPDLILSNQARDGARYDQLRAIAPTVLTQTTGASWKADFQLHAEALSRQDAAAAFVSSYQRHVSQTVQALAGAKASGRRISLVRFVEGGGIRLYGKQNFLGTVLTELQLGRPDSQNVDQFDVEVPPDQIAKADGDLVLYATYGDPEAAGTTATLASPGWQALGAVRAHRAFEVDDQLWFQGIGYTAANYVLAELQRFLGA
ncbi:iron-siderophore ABC transporter substrate-binding protein [Kitasatospora sp. NBC_01560]|uniref:ABC transporter substrate-binding protein n=1 Tax=Kitasatospora sp. NBC_01560 TaxID=2975965 RepID=UPI00386CF592